jgi:phage terminase large subunit-like protein
MSELPLTSLSPLHSLSRETLLAIQADNRRRITEARERRYIDTLYPDEGPVRRELYPKHLDFFRAGNQHTERAVIGANRVGKSLGTGGYEAAVHLTGEYPQWWPGRKFDRRVEVWAAGKDRTLVRDTIQIALLGPHSNRGTGLIPGDAIKRITPGAGVPDAVDTVYVQHRSGNVSELTFKTYDSGREAFQGAKKDLMWFDEEPPASVYTEGLTRVMATVPGEQNGMVICTFTPLLGISDVVMSYLPGGIMPATEEDRMGAWGW